MGEFHLLLTMIDFLRYPSSSMQDAFHLLDQEGFIQSTHVPAPIDIDCLARDVTISVAIRAGAMVFTVIPSFDSRDAYECVKPIKPAFDAA